jgi:hypothetical protein
MATLPPRRIHDSARPALAGVLLVSLSWVLPTPAAHAQDAVPADAALPEALRGPLADKLATVGVRFGDEILPLLEVVSRACVDEQLAEYRRLRVENGGDAEGQLALARWCRKQGLAEEEQLHWQVLLSMEPDHPDAIKGLHLREYQGLLLTKEQIDELKAQAAQAEQAARKWRPVLRQWKRDIERGDAQQSAAALEQLSRLNDPLALPVVEEVFGLEDASIAIVIVEAIRQMPGDAAANVLARLAVDSADEYVRREAAAALAARPYPEYVPMLLAGLATPIEINVDVARIAGGPITQSFTAYGYTGNMAPAFYNKFRPDGAYTSADVAAWGPEVRRSGGVAVVGYEPDRVEYNYVLTREGADPDETEEASGTIVESDGNARRVSSIDELYAAIDEANAESAALNRRIHDVLTLATNAEVIPAVVAPLEDDGPIDPRWWWDWWRQRIASGYFSGGTEVWTLTGPTPIEEILVGDRVLTRNATGELSFTLVVACDMQPESAMQSIELNSRVIVATLDQQFYVTSVGWKPASELTVGTPLDALAGSRPIEQVAPGDAIARYGLAVAEGASFFVDRHGILAHDATTR